MKGTVVVRAPAKINLFLRVLGGRSDGYHELETLFQAISLGDDVEVSVGEAGEGAVDGITLDVVGPDLGPKSENLAVLAAARFCEVAGVDRSVHIRLVKRTPIGAGFGGGSSDAAAVLRCLAALAGRNDPTLLHTIACELGSDVPFFLGPSPLALGRGRGERLTPLRPLPPAQLVLALPPVQVATGDAYRALAELRGATHPALARDVDTTALGWDEIEALAENDFEPLIAERHDEVRRSLEGLRAQGARWTLLSGSGAAAFGVFANRSAAEVAAGRLEDELGWPFVVSITSTELPALRTAVHGG
jgi:4-diphosphocytidyl-2-C-methyl-D-erythritol kinase